jgi:serine/threonine-protein kinase
VEEEPDTAQDAVWPHADDAELTRGMDVGGYQVDGELGRGGMGIVYSATHPVIGKRVAIKVLKRSLSQNPASVERFLQEARAVNQIGHPNIIDIFAIGKLADGRSYLVMDLLDGEPLRARLKRGPLHVREAAQVIDEIASALAAAHAKGFIHRDLKPDNVFLVAHPGRVDIKLLDFGLAKLLPSAGQRAFRTATGAQLGTPDYMSPEQLRGSDVDGRADVYSLGVMAIEILTARRPRRYSDGSFDGGTPAQLLAGVTVPGPLVELIAAMVQPSPDGRPTVAAVRTVIKRVRPSLPSMSVVGLEVNVPAAPAAQAEPSLAALTATKVGARPVLPTPQAGTPNLQTASPALQGVPAAHMATKLGVPPPPTKVSGSLPIMRASATQPVPVPSRLWLIVSIVLVVATAIALVVVLAT